jgi:hypothetical protein
MNRTAGPSALFPLAAALAALLGGCIINNPPPPPQPGDISFLWSFDGIRSCDEAGVREVDVQVLEGNFVVFSRTVDCLGGGLTLTDFDPGSYELLLDAYSRSGRLLFIGEAVVRVQAGRDNDIGLVQLRRPGAAAGPTTSNPGGTGTGTGTGEAALYWSFRYPTDDSIVTSCLTAGVEAVHVDLVAVTGSGAGFSGTFDCYDEGVEMVGIAPGRYTLFLDAEGSYQGAAIRLYEGAFEFDVEGGRLSDLGDLPLERVFESFADIELRWQLGSSSCQQLGVTNVTFVITRLDGQKDDEVTVDCNRAFVLRETFLPGSYLLEGYAQGAAGAYYASATRNVAPNTTAATELQLVLTP